MRYTVMAPVVAATAFMCLADTGFARNTLNQPSAERSEQVQDKQNAEAGQVLGERDYIPDASTPNQRILPPLRSRCSCTGPAAAAPCREHHGGFLYYGTYPWDDDWFNGFDDCPGGRCGYAGRALSIGWIQLHNRRPLWKKTPPPAGHRRGGCPRCRR